MRCDRKEFVTKVYLLSKQHARQTYRMFLSQVDHSFYNTVKSSFDVIDNSISEEDVR